MRSTKGHNIISLKWEGPLPTETGEYFLLLQVFYRDQQENRQSLTVRVPVILHLR
jgi:hypothetical protein